MTAESADLLLDDLQATLDPVFWAEHVVGLRLDPWQQKVLKSTHRWVALLCARQCGKSTIAAVKAAHLALFTPKSRTLIVCKSLAQAVELFADIQRMVTVALDGAPALEENNKTSLSLLNESRISCVPSSADTIRGYKGINLLIEDEAAFVDDSVHNAVRPMVSISGGTFMMLSSPNGQRGHFYEAWSGPEDWDRYTVRASECPRSDKKFLERERREKGETYYRQEYDCEFLNSDDSVFNAEQVRSAIRDFPLFEFA